MTCCGRQTVTGRHYISKRKVERCYYCTKCGRAVKLTDMGYLGVVWVGHRT